MVTFGRFDFASKRPVVLGSGPRTLLWFEDGIANFPRSRITATRAAKITGPNRRNGEPAGKSESYSPGDLLLGTDGGGVVSGNSDAGATGVAGGEPAEALV